MQNKWNKIKINEMEKNKKNIKHLSTFKHFFKFSLLNEVNVADFARNFEETMMDSLHYTI